MHDFPKHLGELAVGQWFGGDIECSTRFWCIDQEAQSADFIFLMNQTGLTWGNLSAHMAKLEWVGYIEVKKAFKGKRPNTTLQLTDKGRLAFRKYALHMKQVFGDFQG